MARRTIFVLTVVYFLLGAAAGLLLVRLYIEQKGCPFASLNEQELMAHVQRVARIYQTQPSLEVSRCLLPGLEDEEIASLAKRLAQLELRRGNDALSEPLVALASRFGSTDPELLADLAVVTVMAEQPQQSLDRILSSSEPLFAVLRSQSVCTTPGGTVSVAVYGPAGEQLAGQRVCLMDAQGNTRDCSITGLKDPRNPGTADLVLHPETGYAIVLVNAASTPVSPAIRLSSLSKPCPAGQAMSFMAEYVAIAESAGR